MEPSLSNSKAAITFWNDAAVPPLSGWLSRARRLKPARISCAVAASVTPSTSLGSIAASLPTGGPEALRLGISRKVLWITRNSRELLRITVG